MDAQKEQEFFFVEIEMNSNWIHNNHKNNGFAFSQLSHDTFPVCWTLNTEWHKSNGHNDNDESKFSTWKWVGKQHII